MRLASFFLAALLAAGGTLHADVLTIALDVTDINLIPGQTFTFSGVISNNGQSTVDLNGIDVTLDGSLFQVDTSPFFSGPLTVAAGASTPSFTQFSVTVDLPFNGSPGIQTGTLTILGGVESGNIYDPTVQDPLGSSLFSVNVSAIPEPSTFAMMTPAVLAGMLLLSRERRKRRQMAKR